MVNAKSPMTRSTMICLKSDFWNCSIVNRKVKSFVINSLVNHNSTYLAWNCQDYRASYDIVLEVGVHHFGRNISSSG